MSLSADDRRFIDTRLKRYGSAWDEGLAGLERDFEIDAKVKWRKYVLQMTMRSPAGFCSTMTITKPAGELRSDSVAVPKGDRLSAQELAGAEAALKREGSVLLLEPNNHRCLRLDLSRGTEGLCEAPLDLATCIGEDGKPEISPPRSLVTRRRGDFACLYFLLERGWQEPFCLWLRIEGDSMAVAVACWFDIPAPQGGLLTGETFEFLDKAMKENGDFGVYGSVQGGLDDLMEFMEVSMTRRESDEGQGPSWWVKCTPRDGHGHFLNFEIDATTGAIGEAMAGHLERVPDLDDESLCPTTSRCARRRVAVPDDESLC